MSTPELASLAVGLSALLGATAVLWRDRLGGQAALRSVAVASVAALAPVPLAGARGGMLTALEPEPLALGITMAGAWLIGVMAAWVLAALLGWVAAPVEGAVLGALAGAGAGVALAVGGGGGLPAGGIAVAAYWQAAVGAAMGGGLAQAGLRPLPLLRVGLALAAWCGGGGLGGGVSLLYYRWAPWLERSSTLTLGLAALGLAAVAGAVVWLGVRPETALLRRELAEEVGFGVVPAAVAMAVTNWRSRWRGDWWSRADERRALTATLVELSIRKARLRGGSPAGAVFDSLAVGRLRSRLRRSFADPGESVSGEG